MADNTLTLYSFGSEGQQAQPLSTASGFCDTIGCTDFGEENQLTIMANSYLNQMGNDVFTPLQVPHIPQPCQPSQPSLNPVINMDYDANERSQSIGNHLGDCQTGPLTPPQSPEEDHDSQLSQVDQIVPDCKAINPFLAPGIAHALKQQSCSRVRVEKKSIPEECKDARYYERRKRNNAAAKKSRDVRKRREDDIAIRASFLEQENAVLRTQVATLREEASSLRHLLIQKRSMPF